MRSHKMLLLVLASTVAGTSSRRPAEAQQTPTLVAEAGHAVSLSRGSSAQTFQIASTIEVERRPPPAETVEGLLATPFPTVEEARPYLGEWVGDTWMKPQQPRTGDLMLRIRVEDGRVIGETIHTQAPPEYRVTRWQYLKVTENGLTWGFMNGMRPRGVVLFEGILKGDTLNGTSRFGGIDFRLPDGSSPPAHHFAFKRIAK